MSNLILIACLLAGLLLGWKDVLKIPTRLHSALLFGIILLLIFVMGMLLGVEPNLTERLLKYGINALIITLLAMVGGAFSVWLLIKVVRLGK